MTVQRPHDHLRSDPHIGPLVERHGELPIEPAPDPFERLVVAIIRQQVSMAAARAIRERVFDRVAVTPAGIANADPETLTDAGLSARKAEYVRNVATVWREKEYGRAYFEPLSDEAVVDELTDIRGIGKWTANMFLMFCLGRADVFPVQDLGIRNGMRELFDDEITRPEMVDRAEAWRPYRSYASRYIWRLSD